MRTSLVYHHQNIVRAAVDSVSQLLSKPPAVGVRAAGARFEDQYAIEEYENAVDSLFNSDGTKGVLSSVSVDGGLDGTGYAWARYSQGEISIEKLSPWQVFIDPYDARSGKPTTCHILEYKDREAYSRMGRCVGRYQVKDKEDEEHRRPCVDSRFQTTVPDPVGTNGEYRLHRIRLRDGGYQYRAR